MFADKKTRPSLYEQLEALPEGLTGEILNGQLYTQPRPSGAHVVTASALGYELFGPFQRGRGGPGGDWREISWCVGGLPVAVAPFDAVTIDLSDLWPPTEQLYSGR
ncbi:hypothetical protein [Thiocapsa rosea]|uniref:Uncharacterized protein n=1 Tax=Thiocapsa rosea TaxID=69360 RepID=A0A495V5W0_9GAMM|nr:hypothetical protein [Thiocapsa rosea]RKT43993.1 hypothetical protein BDD21_1363 [Thiocapsa rosea]